MQATGTPGTPTRHAPDRATLAGLVCLSAAALGFEIALMRLFSVAQFYHFAFMIISLAMLGSGASGTLLALRPHTGQRHPQAALGALALCFGLSCTAATTLTNALPFDSFSVAWDWRQLGILVLHYAALSLPFLCSGAAVAMLFMRYPGAAGGLYAGNLTGSALGCLAALLAPQVLSGEGVVLLCAALAGLAGLCFVAGAPRQARRVLGAAAALMVLGCGAALLLRPATLALRLSPYKGLNYALQYPGARLVSQRWNGFSRVDVVESPGIRSLPGLSYRSMAALPPQRGIFVDGDDLNPALLVAPSADPRTDAALAFTADMPTAVAYQLRPGGEALVLEARGGLELWVALAQGASQVTGVEANPLILAAAGSITRQPGVTVVTESARAFVRRTAARYDVVTLALATPYRPVRSGATSLAEDPTLTVEAFQDYLRVLKPDGLLVLTRWLQLPPSESLRAFALALTALEASGCENPAQQLAAFRGYATMTILAKASPFTAEELALLRGFAGERAFDLVYLPDLLPEESNRYNVLSEPVYEETVAALLNAPNRAAWYAAYPFDVRPPTDAHPFFGHFFTWAQTPQVVAELGMTWQPFGGAGYFVLVALLLLATVAAAVLIGLPLLAMRHGKRERAPLKGRRAGRNVPLVTFGLLGLGFMLVEVPLMQHFILFLGHPAYAFTAVLFALLLFSGLGSALSDRLPLWLALALLVGMSLVTPWALPRVFDGALGLPLAGRVAVALLVLAPLGMLMGMPFPAALRRLERDAPQTMPWAWGINGACSVIASVLAALLALSFGFRWVLWGGTLCYAAALALERGLKAGDTAPPGPLAAPPDR